MGLKDFRLPTRSISFGDGAFAVRGLGFADIAPIVREHGPALALIFARGRALADDQPNNGIAALDLTQLGSMALDQAPGLVAAIIAAASTEHDLAMAERLSIAGMLPATVQFEALFAVTELTLVTEGGVGKFAEMVTRMMEQMTEGLTALSQPKS